MATESVAPDEGPGDPAAGVMRCGPNWWSSNVAVVLTIASASVLIRVPLFGVPMINDEGGYAYVAHFLSAEYQLYRDIPFYRPQAIFYLYQFILATLGTDVIAMRLFAALWNAGTTVCVFLLGKDLSSRRVGIVAAALFAVFSTGPSIEGFTANAEIFAQLPIVLSALLAWRKKWIWAGVAAAVAVLLKPSGISAWLLATTWAFVTGSSFRGAFKVSAAFGLALLPSLVHGLWIGWEHFWDSMYTRRAALASGDSMSLATQAGRLGVALLDTAPSWAVPATLSGVAVAARVDRSRGFLLLWLGTCVVGMAMGGFWFRHYFIQVVPPLSIMAAVGFFSLASGRRRWIWALPIAVSVAVFSWDLFIWSRPNPEISMRLYGRSSYLAAADAADYVAANTDPRDPIFVAFSQAEIYYLSRRKASFPHMYYGDFQYSQALFDGALRSIREGEPAMVVVAQRPPANRMSTSDFLDVLDGGYELVREVRPALGTGAILIFERRTDDGF